MQEVFKLNTKNLKVIINFVFIFIWKLKHHIIL